MPEKSGVPRYVNLEQSVAEMQLQLSALLETIERDRRHVKRLAVPVSGRTLLLDVKEIDWIEGAENYVRLHAGASALMLHASMGGISRSLDPQNFVRIHRSRIVNLERIREIQSADHGEFVLTLSTGIRLRSGRSYTGTIKALVANPFRR